MSDVKKLISASLLAVGLSPGIACAQNEFPIVTSIETNFAGAAIGMTPDYIGSDDYTFGVLPVFRYEFGDHRFVQLLGNYISANLVNDDNLRFGPALRYRFGRDGDIDDAVVKMLPDIDDAVEAGAMLQGTWIMYDNPRNRFTTGVDAMWDVSGASDGFNATFSAQYWDDISTAVDAGISGNFMLGDGSFNDTYFGIKPTDSAVSGLPDHKSDGGITSVSIQPMIAMHFSEEWHAGAGIRYTRIVGDAADSPIVKDRGSENQFIGGVGVVYSWGGKVNTR